VRQCIAAKALVDADRQVAIHSRAYRLIFAPDKYVLGQIDIIVHEIILRLDR